MKSIALHSRLWVFCLLQGLIVFPLQANKEQDFAYRANLALRQTGHNLLLAQQDTTTTIPPIFHDGRNSFTLSLEQSFDYDLLPQLLEQALEDYDISESYEVVVRHCEEEILILGFNRIALERGNVPCVGRGQQTTCANIHVHFDLPIDPADKSSFPYTWLLIPLAAGLGLLIYRRMGGQQSDSQPEKNIRLGSYSYDPANQLLVIEGEEITLTFRENKLLHYLVQHPNEVLERSVILHNVWEEEGVIVGRSLDVFISRLRKILKRDASVQIKSVHGIGYRLQMDK